MQETILQSIGKTPLVKLRRLTEGLKASVYVKNEAMNPGGSVKDRTATLRVPATIFAEAAGSTLRFIPEGSRYQIESDNLQWDSNF